MYQTFPALSWAYQSKVRSTGLPFEDTVSRTTVAVGAASVVACLFGLIAPGTGRGEDVVRQAVQIAHGRPILADGELAEVVAVDGGKVWIGNPIEAFALDQKTGKEVWSVELARNGK